MNSHALKAVRRARGLTQAQYAKELGLSLRTYQRREAADTTHPNRNEFSEKPETSADPLASIEQCFTLLRMVRDKLKEGNLL